MSRHDLSLCSSQMADKEKKKPAAAIRSLCSKAPSSSIDNFHGRPGPRLHPLEQVAVFCLGANFRSFWTKTNLGNFGKCVFLV